MINNLFLEVKAVIFDMDGLMIDSEPFHQKAYDRVFRQFGKELTEYDNIKYYVGISDKDASVDMVKRYSLPISPEELTSQKQRGYIDVLKEVTPQPGLMDLLKFLKTNHFKTAIASSSMLKEIAAVTRTLKIESYFDAYCSAEQVARGKPAPDLFLFAANKLGVSPRETVVLEDAPKGIEAAVQANMLSIAVPSRETIDNDFSQADLKLNSLKQVIGCLKYES